MNGDYEHTSEFRDAERAYLTEPDHTEREDFNDDVQECADGEATPEQIARVEAVFAKWRAEHGRGKPHV